MSWYDNLINTVSQPFEGVGDSFKDLNLLGASVPESFKQMRDVGLLTPEAYNEAVSKADITGKRNALLKSAIMFGTQNFNQNKGSLFDPVYLRQPLLTAIDEAQKPYTNLPVAAQNKFSLGTFKKGLDDESKRQAYIKELQKGTYGDKFTQAEKDLAPNMTTPQLIDMISGKNIKAPGFQNIVNAQGLTQKYQVVGDSLEDKNNDNIPDAWIPRGEAYRSREQSDIDSGNQQSFKNNVLQISEGSLGFTPKNNKNTVRAANDLSQVAEQLKAEALSKGARINDAESNRQAKNIMIKSGAWKQAGGLFGSEEKYNSDIFLDFYNKSKATSTSNSQLSNQSSGSHIELSNGNIFKPGVGELKLLPNGTYQKVK